MGRVGLVEIGESRSTHPQSRIKKVLRVEKQRKSLEGGFFFTSGDSSLCVRATYRKLSLKKYEKEREKDRPAILSARSRRCSRSSRLSKTRTCGSVMSHWPRAANVITMRSCTRVVFQTV